MSSRQLNIQSSQIAASKLMWLNAVHENFQLNNPSDPLEACIVHSQSTHANSSEVEMCLRYLESNSPYIRRPHFEELDTGEFSTLSVIIANSTMSLKRKNYFKCSENTRQLLGDLLLTSRALTLHCIYKILMEDDFKPSIGNQRRLNHNMKEVVKAEVMKLIDARIIYPISDSALVSPVQVVQKKKSITMIQNEKNKLTRTRTIT
ncbi:RNA-directed DNA polymerase [Abeliophyllum distichum]|uniref:RNA-directed DNA polymerase n=1 Tax=Abeliophyllum distichum TaxID=126358 RepID=A0ABD1S9K8_9LAMI